MMLDCSSSLLARNRFAGNDRQVNKQPATELAIVVTVTYCVVLTTFQLHRFILIKAAGRGGWLVITWSILDASVIVDSFHQGERPLSMFAGTWASIKSLSKIRSWPQPIS